MTVQTMQKNPAINAIVMCDCGQTHFKVGLKTDGIANHIRLLTCIACQKQMPVPFQNGDEADWVPLAKALFEIEHDPKIKDQAWFDFQGKAQRLVRLMNSPQKS